MTYAEALDRLCALRRFGVRPGLERVTAALAHLGHPERRFSVIHVAGTNGKGSTSAFAAALLRKSGRRTGLFTSPHLHRLTERVAVDGVEISPDEIARRTPALLAAIPEITFFEALCAIGFAYFADAGVEVAVVECGLGGLYDSTNVFAAPLATVVTSIARDHTEILGSTLGDIARQKAGIFRAGRPAVIGTVDAEAQHVLAEAAIATGAPILWHGRDFMGRLDGADFSYEGPGGALRGVLPLAGAHQATNAAVALCAVAVAVGDVAARAEALATTRWPGRLERLAPDLLVDAAHNEEGAQALASAWPALGATELVVGLVAEKDAAAMLAAWAPLTPRLWVTEPASPRARPAEELAALARTYFADVRVAADPHAAVAAARAHADGSTVVVAGSIFLIAEVRRHILGERTDPVLAQDPSARPRENL